MSALAEPIARYRFSAGTPAGLFAVATVVFAAAFASFLRLEESSDLTVHIAYARELGSLADLKSPHFLFQFLVRAGYELGLSYEAAAVFLLGCCYGGMAVLIGREISKRGVVLSPLRTVGFVLAVLLASHVFLPTLLQPNLYYGYFVPTAYHNPTQQLNKLFAVWTYFVYRSYFLSARSASLASVPVLATLCVSSALAKPSFLIAFLPAAALYALRDLITRRWRQALLCLAGIGIPSALILLWQSRMSSGGGDPVAVAFAPFVVFNVRETLYKLPASLAFPLVAAVGAWRTRTWNAPLRFIWVFTAVALFFTLCIVESGHRIMHGNFAWTGQTAVFLVYVESMLYLLTRPRGPWERAAWIAFGFHVVCGLVWYGTQFVEGGQQWL